MANTNRSQDDSDLNESDQRFADRLHSYNDQPLDASELAILPEGIRGKVVKEADLERRAEDAMVNRITARTRTAIRADRAARRATERLGARLLHGIKEGAQEAIAWCEQLFGTMSSEPVISWSEGTVPLVLEDEDGREHEFEAQLSSEVRRTSAGTLEVMFQAPITGFPGWNGANAVLFLGPAPNPAEWRCTWIALPALAEPQGDAALLKYEFELAPHQGGQGSDATDAPVSPRAIRQIRLFPLRG